MYCSTVECNWRVHLTGMGALAGIGAVPLPSRSQPRIKKAAVSFPHYFISGLMLDTFKFGS
jgi:hypothetical protein